MDIYVQSHALSILKFLCLHFQLFMDKGFFFVTVKHALNEVPGMGNFALFSKRNMLYSLVLQYVLKFTGNENYCNVSVTLLLKRVLNKHMFCCLFPIKHRHLV